MERKPDKLSFSCIENENMELILLLWKSFPEKRVPVKTPKLTHPIFPNRVLPIASGIKPKSGMSQQVFHPQKSDFAVVSAETLGWKKRQNLSSKANMYIKI